MMPGILPVARSLCAADFPDVLRTSATSFPTSMMTFLIVLTALGRLGRLRRARGPAPLLDEQRRDRVAVVNALDGFAEQAGRRQLFDLLGALGVLAERDSVCDHHLGQGRF